MVKRRAKDPEWLETIKSMPCIVCGKAPPSDAHHLREGMGMGQRASDYAAVPLCKWHHQTSDDPFDPSYHGNVKEFRRKHGSDIDLLAKTIRQALMGGHLDRGDDEWL